MNFIHKSLNRISISNGFKFFTPMDVDLQSGSDDEFLELSDKETEGLVSGSTSDRNPLSPNPSANSQTQNMETTVSSECTCGTTQTIQLRLAYMYREDEDLQTSKHPCIFAHLDFGNHPEPYVRSKHFWPNVKKAFEKNHFQFFPFSYFRKNEIKFSVQVKKATYDSQVGALDQSVLVTHDFDKLSDVSTLPNIRCSKDNQVAPVHGVITVHALLKVEDVTVNHPLGQTEQKLLSVMKGLTGKESNFTTAGSVLRSFAAFKTAYLKDKLDATVENPVVVEKPVGAVPPSQPNKTLVAAVSSKQPLPILKPSPTLTKTRSNLGPIPFVSFNPSTPPPTVHHNSRASARPLERVPRLSRPLSRPPAVAPSNDGITAEVVRAFNNLVQGHPQMNALMKRAYEISQGVQMPTGNQPVAGYQTEEFSKRQIKRMKYRQNSLARRTQIDSDGDWMASTDGSNWSEN
jgi:hypothetical protein